MHAIVGAEAGVLRLMLLQLYAFSCDAAGHCRCCLTYSLLWFSSAPCLERCYHALFRVGTGNAAAALLPSLCPVTLGTGQYCFVRLSTVGTVAWAALYQGGNRW